MPPRLLAEPRRRIISGEDVWEWELWTGGLKFLAYVGNFLLYQTFALLGWLLGAVDVLRHQALADAEAPPSLARFCVQR